MTKEPKQPGYEHYREWKQWGEARPLLPWQRAYFSGELNRARMERFEEVLEVGFGNGEFLQWAQEQGARVTGIEIIPELVEAAQAFGATNWQVLRKVQVPLAMPTILAGLNQTIMMALSMVVIAALIGAGGLGSPVILGLNTLDIGRAVIGGLSIVLIAMVLDRITQSMAGKKQRQGRS